VSSQVSKTHAAIEIIEEAVTIRDLGSRNGIEVNGLAIQRQTQLHPGDKVTLGDVTISIDADSAIFHGGHTPNVRLRDLIKQEQHLRSSGHNPLVDPLQVDPTRLAIAESQREATAMIARPVVTASGTQPVLRVLRITEDFIPRSAFRTETFQAELDSGEFVWIQPQAELAEVELSGFPRIEEFWYEEPEDRYDVSQGKAILLRNYYAMPRLIRVLSARESGRASDGTRILSERSNVEPLAILPA
jgi:hypothetical protein